jgi:hypothetical protein
MAQKDDPCVVARVDVFPIDSAPVTPGKFWGPCLLAPGIDLAWAVGEWDGESWCTDTGFRIDPRFFAALPLLSLLSG